MYKNWKEYLKEEEEKYKKLRFIKCPAFNDEEVHFNYYGLRHLIYKGEKLRTKDEIIKRFNLLPFTPNILKIIKTADHEEKRVRENSNAYFWTIKHQIHSGLRVRIIIRRLNSGTLHFFSIMKE